MSGTALASMLGAHAGEVATSTTAPSESADGLDALMALLAQRQRGEADFTEEQDLALLKTPLRSSGILIYQAPDHLEQRIVQPHPQSAVLDHGVLTVQVGHHRRTLKLADSPQLAPLLDAIRAVLAGDRAALERLFTIHFGGTLGRWQLTLTPRAAPLAATLEHIELQGEGDQVRAVELTQKNGEHSLMHISARS